MKNAGTPILKTEGALILLQSSLLAIPVNIVVALLLCVYLLYNKMPVSLVIGWFSTIAILTIIRWLFSRYVVNHKVYIRNTSLTLKIFFYLTLLMGLAWGACYLLFLPYLNEIQEFIIILMLGGMCAGGITSLAVYLPAFYAYTLSAFLPVIIYNYSLFTLNRLFLAVTFTLFIMMIMLIAKTNKKMLNKIFTLSEDKEKLIKQLEVMSVTDSLTNLYNQRYFKQALEEEIKSSKRNSYDLNLVCIDIDNFKLINDNFGHPYGDKYLVYFSKFLKETFRRANDKVCRIGGDEFIVITSNVAVEDVVSRCELFKEQFIASKPPHDNRVDDSSPIFDKITLSFGVVHIPYDCPCSLDKAMLFVDKALYKAKEDGKNRIMKYHFNSNDILQFDKPVKEGKKPS